jgi:glycosyltransferase involved in cell wall biosynthesis
MKIVGVNHSGYNTVRNISSLPFRNYKVEKKKDLFKYPEFLYYKLTGKTHPLYFNLHQDFGLAGCDIWHFFNVVSFSKKPWLTTFETMTPRFHGKYQRAGVKLLAGEHCKKLIGMSDCAKNLQLQFIKTNHPMYYEAIAPKIITIHPSQKLLIQNYSEKKLEDVLSFVIVGTEFFRKGGNEVLEVFDKLLTEGHNIKLHIVSKLEYTGSHATVDDYNKALAIIEKHKTNIMHHNYLPNSEVLELLVNCHVALLPSYRETYGYSILEAQAAGCPVISTDIIAFGEINNNNIGWLLNVPCDEMHRPLIRSKEERQKFSNEILSQLEAAVRNIIADPSLVKTKGEAALRKIETKNNPILVAQQIEGMYNEALKS